MSQTPNQTPAAPPRVIEIAFSVPAAAPKPEPPQTPPPPKVEPSPPKPAVKPVRPTQPRVKAQPVPVAEPTVADLPAPPPEPVLAAPPPVSAEPAPPVEPRTVAMPSPVAELPVTPAVFDADYLHNPEPEYPRAAKRLGVQGTVIIRVTVTANGTAEKLLVVSSSGSPLLDDAALAAVQRWTFVPARRGEEAITAMVDVPIRFTLQR